MCRVTTAPDVSLSIPLLHVDKQRSYYYCNGTCNNNDINNNMCRSAVFTAEASLSSSSFTNIKPLKGVEAEYTLGKVLGSGMFSTVRLGVHKITGTLCAIKILNTMANGRETLDKEIRAMKLVKQHPNVVTLYEVIEDEEEGKTYMIMEYCGMGTMHDYLEKNGAVTEDLARKWTRQLVDALSHCHRRRVVHLDVKPANIYLDENLNIKLGDFGLVAVTLNAYTDQLRCSTGSPVYAAPEVYLTASQGIPYYGPPAAMWAAGVTLHAMLTMSLPFEPHSYQTTWDSYTPPNHVSAACQDFLRTALAVDPSKRLTEDEACGHKWLVAQCSCPMYMRTDSYDCFVKGRMCELGFSRSAVDCAAKSNAVMDPTAATFSMLQTTLSQSYRPMTASRLSSLTRRVPSERNLVGLEAALTRRVPSERNLVGLKGALTASPLVSSN